MDSEGRRREEDMSFSKEVIYKTKLVQFLGRTTPIILQNDNGPCPLLAICNVLLLRNNLNLNPNAIEVSQEKLLSLVAERLIDSNSNANDKDVGYVENQQKNIDDAIDLLPRLATGIDVNIKFQRIDDFEYTRECAIFDLLDIGLYHGWILDPQDHHTNAVIGSKSYNGITGELVALETLNMKGECKNSAEEDAIDFVAAITATLGVPCPRLTRGKSFDESPFLDSDQQKCRKGDMEEEAELLRILQLSTVEKQTPVDDSFPNTCEYSASVDLDGITCQEKCVPLDEVDAVEGQTVDMNGTCPHLDSSLFDVHSPSGNDLIDLQPCDAFSKEAVTSASTTDDYNVTDLLNKESILESLQNNVVVGESVDAVSHDGKSHSLLHGCDDITSLNEEDRDMVGDSYQSGTQSLFDVDISEESDRKTACDAAECSSLDKPNADPDSYFGSGQEVDVPEILSPSVDCSEPIYEGEERILDAETILCENCEPVYEGEAVLAEGADKVSINDSSLCISDEITPREGELIRSFLKNNASQLTIYGLFCLQDGLKERELCVFFRNNHFSTMFKIDGQLYLLATDQGYINQPDLVWEKLNEVNGDTLYMTGNFKEFKLESHSDGRWDQGDAMATTADYIASIDESAHAGSNLNTDLQLAIALQQQEFGQQPQRTVESPSVGGTSRIVTGPQVRKRSNNSSTSTPSLPTKYDGKSKDKCIVM